LPGIKGRANDWKKYWGHMVESSEPYELVHEETLRDGVELQEDAAVWGVYGRREGWGQ
jgi:hypothetical protein